MSSTRIRGCKSADIQKIVKQIQRFNGAMTEPEINKIIKVEAELKTKEIISLYDINYCKIIITNHLKGNIYDLVCKLKVKSIDLDNETIFYRQIIYSYVYEIVYTKINNTYYRIKQEQKECSICLDKIEAQALYTTQCGHKFHNECYLKWVKHRGKSCPNCRERL